MSFPASHHHDNFSDSEASDPVLALLLDLYYTRLSEIDGTTHTLPSVLNMPLPIKRRAVVDDDAQPPHNDCQRQAKRRPKSSPTKSTEEKKTSRESSPAATAHSTLAAPKESLAEPSPAEPSSPAKPSSSVTPSPSATPSPTEEIKLELETSFDDSFLPIVPIEAHMSDNQAFMTGAVAFSDTVAGELGVDEDDNIHCKPAFNIIAEQMPYKVIRRNKLLTLGIGVDRSTISCISEDFLTTYLGIQHAIDECAILKATCEYIPQYANLNWDQQFMFALGQRGGYAADPNQQIIFPEDIIPLEALQGKAGGGWEADDQVELHDKEYWFELKAQKEIWNELPEIPDFRHLRYR